MMSCCLVNRGPAGVGLQPPSWISDERDPNINRMQQSLPIVYICVQNIWQALNRNGFSIIDGGRHIKVSDCFHMSVRFWGPLRKDSADCGQLVWLRFPYTPGQLRYRSIVRWRCELNNDLCKPFLIPTIAVVHLAPATQNSHIHSD